MQLLRRIRSQLPLRLLLSRNASTAAFSSSAGGDTDQTAKDASSDSHLDDLDPNLVPPGDPRSYPSHRPLDPGQRVLLAFGSGVACLAAPWRDDMINTFGETTGVGALRRLRERMLEDPIGKKILAEKPRIRTSTVDLQALRNLPPGSLGRAYTDFLDRYGYSPDARRSVSFVEDSELAYVMQRYRETHDLNHVLLGQGTDFLGEVVVKWFEAFQTGLPLCVTGAVLGSLRLRPKQTRRYLNGHLAYALRTGSEAGLTINYDFERNWAESLANVRRSLRIGEPPVLA